MRQPANRCAPAVAALLVLVLGGCGSKAPDRHPTAAQMSQLEHDLSDARAAQQRHDGPAATAALQALAQDLIVMRHEHRLPDALASTLTVEVAQARARVGVDLPASTSAAAAPTPAAAPPASTPTPAAVAPPDAHGPSPGPGKGDKHGKGTGGKGGHGGHGGGGGD